VGLLEGVGDRQDELAGGGADEADAQRVAHPAGGGDRPLDALPDALVGGAQVLLEAAADGRRPDPAARPLEQRGAHLLLELLDRLADPGRAHVQALGGAAEVQFVGQGQEDLDVALLHGSRLRAGRPT
jgi:hypothetical protein